ncbi:hypothetical protein GIB67_005731 [Kingdonia uniflora]|uniref:Aminotransferase-like plant mobile domain-containing protein n=1 Tax=Kingdonia uniflora TaxID=39325 RepID=A0A7J7KVE4_9MAGN|nr:hypothetical protein GIB67_005731 [Kingdonia uniflora]
MRVHGTFTTVFKVWKDISTILPVRDAVVNIFGQFMDIRMGNSDNWLIQFQTTNDTVPLGYLAAVADLDSAAQYDWGSAILASLYYGLDIAVTTGVPSLDLSNFLRQGIGKVLGLSVPQRAWERGNRRKTNDQTTNQFIQGRYHIDHRTVETITWEPWLDSAVSETEDVLIAKLISRKRMPLQVPNKNCNYYLEDRCWRQLEGEARIPLDPPLSMPPHISPAALHEMRQAGFLDYLFGLTALRAGVTPMVVTSASVHSVSQDFSLPGEAEGPDSGQHLKWTGRRGMLPIARLRNPPPMSSTYGVEELWHLTHDIR